MSQPEAAAHAANHRCHLRPAQLRSKAQKIKEAASPVIKEPGPQYSLKKFLPISGGLFTKELANVWLTFVPLTSGIMCCQACGGKPSVSRAANPSAAATAAAAAGDSP